MSDKFKVGNKVVVNKISQSFQNLRIKKGMLATIKLIESERIGLEFDEDINGHALDGNYRNKHCWWITDLELKNNFIKIDSLPKNEKEFKIGDIVERDKNLIGKVVGKDKKNDVYYVKTKDKIYFCLPTYIKKVGECGWFEKEIIEAKYGKRQNKI